MKSLLRGVVAAMAVASVGDAQVPQGHWVLSVANSGAPSQSGLYVADPSGAVITQPQPQSAAMTDANTVVADERGFVWYATRGASLVSPLEVFAVVMDQNTVSREVKLTNGPVVPVSTYLSINGLCLRGDTLWFVVDDGSVGGLQTSMPNQSPTMLPALPVANNQGANSIATDGRELFVAVWELWPSSLVNVFAIDPSAPTPVWRGAANTHGVPRAAQMSGITLGPDGSLLTSEFDGFVRRTDLQAGSTVAVGPASPAGGLTSVGYNPWLGQALCVTLFSPRAVMLDLASSTWRAPVNIPLAAGTASGVAPVCEQPFLRFGDGCVGDGGVEPRAWWSGLPTIGGSFDVRLVGGVQNSCALLAIGDSRTSWSGLTLPFDWGQVGAAGCALRVSPDSTFLVLTPNGVGAHSIAIPPNPTLRGLGFFAQWLVPSSANALGWVSSEGVAIRMR